MPDRRDTIIPSTMRVKGARALPGRPAELMIGTTLGLQIPSSKLYAIRRRSSGATGKLNRGGSGEWTDAVVVSGVPKSQSPLSRWSCDQRMFCTSMVRANGRMASSSERAL